MGYSFVSGRSILMTVVVFIGLAIGVYLNAIRTESPIAQLGESDNVAKPPSVVKTVAAQVAPIATPLPEVAKPLTRSVVLEYQLQREQSRSAQMELLRQIAANPDGAPVVRQEAEQRLLDLARLTELEVNLAGLLRAEGFADPIVVAGEHGVTVSLGGLALTPETAAKIGNLAARMSGFDQSKVVILERAEP